MICPRNVILSVAKNLGQARKCRSKLRKVDVRNEAGIKSIVT